MNLKEEELLVNYNEINIERREGKDNIVTTLVKSAAAGLNHWLLYNLTAVSGINNYLHRLS